MPALHASTENIISVWRRVVGYMSIYFKCKRPYIYLISCSIQFIMNFNKYQLYKIYFAVIWFLIIALLKVHFKVHVD
jgi:hypothetical protein